VTLIGLFGMIPHLVGLPALTVSAGLPGHDLAVPLLLSAPRIDGQLGEAEWRGAVSAFGFRALGAGRVGDPQPFVLLGRDGEAFTLAARLPLPPGAKPKAIAGRDGPLWDGDSVELFLDPHPGDKVYYQFIVNAAGTVWDSRGQDNSFDTVWQAGAHVGDGFWSAEMRIPFASLNVAPPGEGDVWGVNVGWDRQTPSPAIMTWAPVVSGFHEPDHFRRVAFLAGACPFAVRDWRSDPRAGTLTMEGTCSAPTGRTARAAMKLCQVTGGQKAPVASASAEAAGVEAP